MSLSAILPARLWRRHPRVVATAALVAGCAFAVLLAVCGTDSPWVPKCLFHTVTGLDCPGCGSQRAISALLNGHFSEAWHFNPALWIGLCVAALYAVFPGKSQPPKRVERILYSPVAFIAIVVAIITWTVWRNIA